MKQYIPDIVVFLIALFLAVGLTYAIYHRKDTIDIHTAISGQEPVADPNLKL